MNINESKEYSCIVSDNNKSLVKFLYTKSNSKSLNFDNCTKIKAGCFKNTTGIEMFCINYDSTLEIEENAFENSSDLKTLVIEEKSQQHTSGNEGSVQEETTKTSKVSIQSNAFKNCNSLDCIHIKANEVTIESNAFSQCYYLRIVVIESDVIHVRKEAFEQSNNLCILGKPKTLKQYCSKNNIEYMELT